MKRLSFGMVKSGLVPEKAFLRLFFAYLEFKARNRGEFIHHNRRELRYIRCPHCRCPSYFAFLDPDHSRTSSSPDDAYECAACGAVTTSRDFGSWEVRT